MSHKACLVVLHQLQYAMAYAKTIIMLVQSTSEMPEEVHWAAQCCRGREAVKLWGLRRPCFQTICITACACACHKQFMHEEALLPNNMYHSLRMCMPQTIHA